jgi:hypothetical protein
MELNALLKVGRVEKMKEVVLSLPLRESLHDNRQSGANFVNRTYSS